MKLIETILNMETAGFTLTSLCRSGVVSPKISLYKDIYLYVDARRKCNKSRTQAVTDAEIQFGVGKTTIYDAIKMMTSNIPQNSGNKKLG